MATSVEPISHTIVGIFGDGRRAAEALRDLDAAGFDPDRIQLVADDPSRAAEIGGRDRALAGALGGLAVGVLLTVGFSLAGGLARDPVGLALGAAGVIGGSVAIGFIVGRTLGRHVPDAHRFAGAVRRNGAVVAVECHGRERELAAQVLDGAGAREVRDEAGPEAL